MASDQMVLVSRIWAIGARWKKSGRMFLLKVPTAQKIENVLQEAAHSVGA